MPTRKFSSSMRETNSAYLANESEQANTMNIGFILLEHFSMMSFTAAVDVLVTANLVQSDTVFKVSSYALKANSITSDLGIDITPSNKLSDIKSSEEKPLDMLIVCGGLRCTFVPKPKLAQALTNAAKQNIILGSIWNGIIPLAQAKLLQDQTCALHIDNHPLMKEHFPDIKITDKSYIFNDSHLSCADALGALDMMLNLIHDLKGPAVSRAVREILSCNRSREGREDTLIQFGDNEQLPTLLRSAIQLMNSNIEEPIAIDEMASYLNANRRQLERLFKQHLNTSPSRHYLEIRLTYARRLLIQSNDSITNIAIASGFVSSNHFSNCFSQYFKMPPSACRKRKEEK